MSLVYLLFFVLLIFGLIKTGINRKWWPQIFQLKVDGVALRLLPEASQIQNAMKVRLGSILMFIPAEGHQIPIC